MKKHLSLPALLLLAVVFSTLLLLPAGSPAEAASPSGTVVTSFYPVWILTRNLLDGAGDIAVRNLAAPSVGCLHDYQLQPADMKVLSGADALLVNGAGMEAFLPEITRSFPDLPVIEASAGIELLKEGDALQIGDAEEEAVNSHIWLDPLKAVQMAENLAAGLSSLFPEQEERILANLDACRERLTRLDLQLREGLKDLPRREIVTFHEAFPYFAAAYDLHVVAVVNKEPGEVLTPAQMGRLALEIGRLGNPPLFVEPQYADLSAQTLSRETGSAVYSLDPVVTGPEKDVPLDYYETVMLENMQVLITALSSGQPEAR